MRSVRLLAVDIGNTAITLGLFTGKRLVRAARIPTGEPHAYAGRVKRFLRSSRAAASIDRVIVASVVPAALTRLRGALKKVVTCRIDVTGQTVTIPIANRYRKKGEVGQDRLVNAYAAGRLYGTPAVVIDFGTAVTFDVVGRKGEYLGGLIMPGIGLSLASLYERTALLPRVVLREAKDIIAKDTVSSIRGGILFGFGAMCDDLVSRYRSILGRNMKVIATGGNARLVKKHARSIRVIDDNLTLEGLQLLSNQKVI